MNDIVMPNYRQWTPSSAKRPRLSCVDANFAAKIGISNYQSKQTQNTNGSSSSSSSNNNHNNHNNNNIIMDQSHQWRRSSLAFFSDGSPMKVDSSFHSDIFRPENVLGMNKTNNNDVHLNANETFSPIEFPFSNQKTKANNSLAEKIVSATGDKSSRSVTKTIPPPPFAAYDVVTPEPSPSFPEQQLEQRNPFATTSTTLDNISNQKYGEQELFPSSLSSSSSPSTTDASQQQPQQQQQRHHQLHLPSKVRFRSHQAESWLGKYSELLKFRVKIGHCLVPNQFPSNPPLAEWVKRQRYQYKLKGMGKHSSMSDERVAMLEKLDFVWNSHDAVWEERLKELKRYKNIFGNTNVPSKYEHNPQLAIWIKRQRRQYKFLTQHKPSTMTLYRMEKLNEIDFSWSGRKPKALH